MTTLDDLLADIDVPEWLDDQALDYRRASSGELNLRECPFCGDGRWRVYFSPAKRRGICFHGSCRARFNLFSFARQALQLDNRGTAQHFRDYASRYGLRPPTPLVTVSPRPEGWELPEHVPLPTPDGMTHPFLIERRITLETQALFGLLWCESGRFTYLDHEDRQRQMDFSGRVLIPVADLDGSIQTFIGRDATKAAERRYLFAPTLPGTGRFLYGGHLVVGREHLVVVGAADSGHRPVLVGTTMRDNANEFWHRT